MIIIEHEDIVWEFTLTPKPKGKIKFSAAERKKLQLATKLLQRLCKEYLRNRIEHMRELLQREEARQADKS